MTHFSTPKELAVSSLLALSLLAGCKSGQEKATDVAKQQAAASGQAQQVITTDKDGNTTTTVVQPPVPGQTTQAITTTTTSTRNATAAVAPSPAIARAPVAQPYSGPNASQSPPDYPAASPQPLVGSVVSPVSVHIPAGTSLVIRINEHISVKNSHVGERFSGEVAEGITGPNSSQIVIPRGTPVSGVIDASHRRGHFKGASILELRLTSLSMNGQRYALDTHDLVRTKKGKGKRSAAFIGGGAGLGMLVGGVATGGVGLLVGGLAGAGGGTAIAGLTGNRDLDIPAESLMRFKLADDLYVQPAS